MGADTAQIGHNEKGRPFHKVYQEPRFDRVLCLEHGFDAASWTRRCTRFKQLLSNADALRLGVHIDYEIAGACNLVNLTLQAAELMRAADNLGMHSFHLVAILMVSR